MYHSNIIWNAILGEEVGEVNRAVLGFEFNNTEPQARVYALNHLRSELVQVAAVCCAWIETINNRDLPTALHQASIDNANQMLQG